MTFDEAVRFFARHGNVSSEFAKLSGAAPTRGELKDAVDFAVGKGQPRTLALEAARAISDRWYGATGETPGEPLMGGLDG